MDGLMCHVCQDTRTPADTTLKGRPVHSWHLGELQPVGMRSAEIEGGKYMGSDEGLQADTLRKYVVEDHLDDAAIASKLALSVAQVRYQRMKLHILRRRGRRHDTPAKAITATAAPHVSVDLPVMAESKPNGHATARVVMFELAGSNDTIRAAVDAVRDALHGRSINSIEVRDNGHETN